MSAATSSPSDSSRPTKVNPSYQFRIEQVGIGGFHPNIPIVGLTSRITIRDVRRHIETGEAFAGVIWI
jgi:hypothetical protein